MARTQNSIRNIFAAMVGQLGGVLVNLLARVFFLHYLNHTYLGLNGLFTNVLTMLSLVELGVGPAMAYSLYKPLADGDVERIKSHMAFYKKAYITIGLTIAALGLVFLPFYTVFMDEVPDIPHMNIIYLLFVGNRGLCGMYNHAVLRLLERLAAGEQREAFLVTCGRWGQDAVRRLGLPIERAFDEISDTPSAEDGRAISSYLKELYLSEQADEIILVYQHHQSILAQTPVKKTLLPLTPGEESPSPREYIFEPEERLVLDRLAELSIDATVTGALLEARVSEHAARMSAMTTAANNAVELSAHLKRQLNHLRQSAITTEISEVSGGAAALAQTRR